MSFKRILAAIDHSSLSRQVFEQASELAQTDGARLMLLHCLTANTVAGAPQFSGELGWSPQFFHQAYENQNFYLEHQSRACVELLQHYCNLAVQRGVAAEFDYRIVDAGQGICRVAHSWGADLIVVGRRGRKGLTEALLGSVSNYILHHAPCAVLVMQSPISPDPAIALDPSSQVAESVDSIGVNSSP